MIHVFNKNNDEFERFLKVDFFGREEGGPILGTQPPYLNFINKFWENSDVIKLFAIKKNDLINLFFKDIKPSSEKKKVMIVVEKFSDHNNPDELILKWKRHKGGEYSNSN